MLSTKQKEEFYIRLYFNTDNGYEIAGLKRAYLDFNRTLVIKNKNQKLRDSKRRKTEQYLKKKLLELISKDINSQNRFDVLHEELCENLIKEWPELTMGQAQKWINMTLKYWLLFGENRINNIELNAAFLHIPIDSYVQKGMFNEKTPRPWSKLDSYETYFSYQEKHREKNTGNPPIIDELEFFNKYKK